jgi:hypothetical protein
MATVIARRIIGLRRWPNIIIATMRTMAPGTGMLARTAIGGAIVMAIGTRITVRRRIRMRIAGSYMRLSTLTVLAMGAGRRSGSTVSAFRSTTAGSAPAPSGA